MFSTAAVRPLAEILHVTPAYGNGMRVFTALRQLNLLKADDVVYRMVIKSLVKRKRRVQDPALPIDVDAGQRDDEEEKHIDRFEFHPSFLSFPVYPVLHCSTLCCIALLCTTVIKCNNSCLSCND